MSAPGYKRFYRRHLPPHEPQGATLSATFRLAGSIPRHVVERLSREPDQRRKALDSIDDPQERRGHPYVETNRFFGKWDEVLDGARAGPSWLSNPGVDRLVAQALHENDGQEYDLGGSHSAFDGVCLQSTIADVGAGLRPAPTERLVHGTGLPPREPRWLAVLGVSTALAGEVSRQTRRRHPLRLEGYDYTQSGAYFVTICVNRHRCIFGEVRDAAVWLNDSGQIVWECWNDLAQHYPHVETDAFVVMPNHVHGIVTLTSTGVGAGLRPAPTGSEVELGRHGLPEIVRALKSFSARGVNQLRGTPGARVWQRGYYERVVRDNEELNRIREYISENPARWLDDEYHPLRAGLRR